MTKYLLLLSLFISISLISLAQGGFHIGPKIGANMGKIDGAGFSENYSLGYHAGAFVEIGLNSQWALQGEVLFNQLNTDTVVGFNAVYNNLPNQDFKNPQLNYLSIPLLLSFRPGKLLSLQAGPQYGILIDNNINALDNGRNAFKNGDLSMLFGAQLHIAGFRVYGRYAIGLNNINDLPNNNAWKTSTIQVGLALDLL